MENRDFLQNGSKIWLTSMEDESLGEFIITDVCGQGGSAICYRAKKNNRNGILKEFYPLDSEIKQYSVNLSRKNSADSKLRGQLYSEITTLPNFINLRNIYCNSCQAIISAKTSEEELNNFIPGTEIFKSYTDNSNDLNYTYYTWVLEDTSIKSFDEILSEICIDTENYENKFKNTLLIIDSVLELAKSVCLLHISGLYHLDLTPANFGVSTYMGLANKNVTISLYDTNTIYSQRFDNYIASGTPGFRSPEVEEGNKDGYSIYSDIYSIGSILYYAFVTDKNNKNCMYGREKYGKKAFDLIDNDLKNSVFLKLSDETVNTFVYNDLLLIIKKALNIYDDPCGRFNRTEDLIEAIELLKSKFSVLVGQKELESYGADWIDTKIKPKEEHYNETIKTGATGAIQWLLYKYPLYDYKVTDTDLNVLVLGCGTYSSKFIDMALELSQIDGLYLNLTIVCEKPDEDKKIYLDERPEFCSFFCVDGDDECKKTVKPYGNIEFKKARFEFSNSYSCLKELTEGKSYSYVFIALNDENLNKNIAQACSEYLNDDNKTIVSYIVYDKENCREQIINKVQMTPVCVKDILVDQKDYKFLERMAFNAHLLWLPCGISDLEEAEVTFYNDEYNYSSSLKNALSIKYKLYSIGINLNSENPYETANVFKKSYAKNKATLIMYEQRRWNVGQITDGWRVMEKSEYDTLRTTTKNRDEKKHPVICDAGKDNSLEEWDKDKWNNADISDINNLDSLDRMSVYMHRYFVELSKRIRKNGNIIEGQLSLLSKIVNNNVRLTNLLSFFSGTVYKILNDDSTHCNLLSSYKYYKASFERKLEVCSVDDIDTDKVRDCLKNIDDELFPVTQSYLYKNWKNNNVKLIENIPFILTYSENIHICMPMVLGKNNSVLFFNVASAIKVRPDKVTYIIDGEAVIDDAESFYYTLSYICRMFDFYKVQTRIDFVVLKNKYISNDFLNRNKIKQKFKIINKIDYIDHYNSNKQAVLTSYLRSNQSADNIENHFSALEYPDKNLSDLYNFFKNANQNSNNGSNIVPAFYFDEKSQNFIAYDSDCEWLNYVTSEFEQNLHVKELFNDNEVIFSEPELSHCIDCINDILTNEYDIWCKLCDTISSEIERNRKLTEVCMDQEDGVSKSECEFLFPSYCEKAVTKIVNKLKYYNVISTNFDIVRLTSKTSLLKIDNLSECCKFAFEKLFENYIWLRDETLINIKKSNNNIIICSDEKLNICNMLIDDGFDLSEKQRCFELLHKLSEMHLITGLKMKNIDGNIHVSFWFPSIYEKRLLSNRQKIVQVVLYYRLLEYEFFDDIQSDVQIFLNEDVSVQVDAVATKGFKTFIFFAESMNSDCLSIAREINERFGINSDLIFVKNTDLCNNKIFQNFFTV